MSKEEVFRELKKIFKPFESELQVVHNKENIYYLNAGINPANKKDMFFGSINIKKNYVAFHLMPVYVDPTLLENISPALRKKMQGKSCFNFNEVQSDLFQELEELSRQGLESYRKKGYLRS